MSENLRCAAPTKKIPVLIGTNETKVAMIFAENETSSLTDDEITSVVYKAVANFEGIRNVLLIHPDYSRHDFTNRIAPRLYEALAAKGLKRLDTLNAGGTHRAMTEAELLQKVGLDSSSHQLLGRLYNHEFDNEKQLVHVVDISDDFVAEKTSGHLRCSMPITVNRLLTEDYDLIVAISGTVPHEAIGFSGGTKIFFPGIAGPEVIGLLHWAAVLIGIPGIIGTLNNPARDVVDEGTRHIFNLVSPRPILSLNMVYEEDAAHNVVPKGLYTGEGLAGFQAAVTAAANLSSRIHVVYVDEPKTIVVQQLPEMYDEVWTAGKGSYKLQKPGVLSEGSEIILYAPHIHCFHSNKTMDQQIRQIGYHGREWVVDYCKRNPTFNKNVASHVINVRGIGKLVNGVESFSFKVSLATQIPEADCVAAGLGYRDPKSIDRQDFQSPDKLWIQDGGQWLYARR